MKLMTLSTQSLIALSVLSVGASQAQANSVHAKLSDIGGSASFDGWNELNRNRVGGALTEAQLAAGTLGNVTGSGDALLTRLSGNHYPAGAGLYGGASVLSFSDSSLVNGLGSLVFQGIINDFDAQFGSTPFSLTLSYNGGNQALAATQVSHVLDGGASDLHTYSWDLSGLGPVSSYTLTLNAGFSQMLAFQVDQVSAVPEPASYAMLLGGLALVGGLARHRQQKAA